MISHDSGLISGAEWASLLLPASAVRRRRGNPKELQMSHTQSFTAPLTRSRKPIHWALLAAGVLFAVLLITELAIVLHAAPTFDPLAPYYVT
jgi:hypothetical protein